MSKRINFTVTSRNLNSLRIPAYAMQQDGETRVEAAARALASANGLVVIGYVSDDGSATLGERNGTGWTPRAEVRVNIQ